MSIGIDPRTFSVLLRLQLVSSLPFDSTQSSSAGGYGSLFDVLLGNALSGSESAALTQASLLSGNTGGEPGSSFPYPAGYYSTGYGLIGSSPMYSSSLLQLLLDAQTKASNAALAGTSGRNESAYDALIEQSARRYGVDPALVKAVVRTESSFNPFAVSRAGAKGLMQLMDATARSVGVADSFDPAQNVEGGTRYLAYLLGKYNGSLKAALAAYNAGPGRVDRIGIRSDEDYDLKRGLLPQETQNYVVKVLDAFDQYRTAKS